MCVCCIYFCWVELFSITIAVVAVVVFACFDFGCCISTVSILVVVFCFSSFIIVNCLGQQRQRHNFECIVSNCFVL